MCVMIAGVMAMGSLSAAPLDGGSRATSCAANDWDFQAEAARLLKEVQSSTAQLTRDADRLHSYARGGISRESHVQQVSLVKEHINSMGKHLERLQAIRHLATPQQQQAILSMMPAALVLATHTELAIEHLNDRGKPLWDQEYKNHVRGISDRSVQMKQVVDLHLEMADTQEKLEGLRERAILLGS
jgi:hypothetical protein